MGTRSRSPSSLARTRCDGGELGRAVTGHVPATDPSPVAHPPARQPIASCGSASWSGAVCGRVGRRSPCPPAAFPGAIREPARCLPPRPPPPRHGGHHRARPAPRRPRLRGRDRRVQPRRHPPARHRRRARSARTTSSPPSWVPAPTGCRSGSRG
jgi:hypothetical protein